MELWSHIVRLTNEVDPFQSAFNIRDVLENKELRA